MLRYAQNKKIYRVARMQPPYPLATEDFEKMTVPGEIIKKRHDQLKSWDKLSRELGGVNVGTLASIAKGKRYPTSKLIDKMNRLYTCHVTPRTVAVTPCARCGHVHVTKRCTDKTQPTKYAKHPVMRVTAIRRMLQNPYLQS